jgi:pimeloyl-ACP methyl ester carboxylesterase
MFDLFSTLLGIKSKPVITEDSIVETVEEIKRPTILMIHGANATSKSFAYFKSQLPDWKIVTVDYNSTDGFYYNLERIVQHTKTLGPLFVIAHSLGGVYALHMLQHLNIKQVFSVSTPFAGSAMADWARYMMPNYQLFRDIGTRSQPIVQAKEIEVTIPWTQIVTTQGAVPWIKGDNDGVVTIKSMNCRNDMENIYVDENHYEVLASDFVVTLIKERYLVSRI